MAIHMHHLGQLLRVVIASINKLNPDSGAVSAKCSATSLVHAASFEAELDGATFGLKNLRRDHNILLSLVLYCL